MFRMPMIYVEFIVLFVLCATAIIQGVYLNMNPDPYALYDAIGPSGFLFIISSLIIITIIVHLIQERKKIIEVKEGSTEAIDIRKLTYLVGVTAIFILLMDYLGFFVSSMIYFFILFQFYGVQPLINRTILSIVFSVSIYLIFVQALNMSLPYGGLWELLRVG